MVQSIFEEMGGRYERQGEYILATSTKQVKTTSSERLL